MSGPVPLASPTFLTAALTTWERLVAWPQIRPVKPSLSPLARLSALPLSLCPFRLNSAALALPGGAIPSGFLAVSQVFPPGFLDLLAANS
ncbi:MAG: hypothetical protein LBS60_12965 [Deltaproteobacteria bacterium]|nr:hypothetical protein [Deltaproteobacteria bacterium]